MDDWREELPEPLREAPYFKAAESLDQAIDGLNDAAQWQGNSLRIPGHNATEEQMQTFLDKAVEKIPGLMPVPGEDNVAEVFGKLGRPAEATEYALPEIDDRVKLSQEDVDAMKTWAHENNMTQGQFERFINLNATRILEAGQAQDEGYASEVSRLSEEWGQDYSRRMESIAAWMRSDPEHPPELVQAFEEGRVSAPMAKWLYGIVEAMAEGGDVNKLGKGDPVPTPGEAQVTMQELTEALVGMSQSDPRYNELQRQRIEMSAIITDARDEADRRKLEDYNRVR